MLLEDERGRQQDVIAASAVDRAPHWVDHQPRRERGLLDALTHAKPGLERLLVRAVGHQLDTPEQSPAPNVADVRVRTERCPKIGGDATGCRPRHVETSGRELIVQARSAIRELPREVRPELVE